MISSSSTICAGSSSSGQCSSTGTSASAMTGTWTREDEAHRGADVVVDVAALPDRRGDAGEAVVQQHDGGRFARHVGAALAHRDADVARP